MEVAQVGACRGCHHTYSPLLVVEAFSVTAQGELRGQSPREEPWALLGPVGIPFTVEVVLQVKWSTSRLAQLCLEIVEKGELCPGFPRNIQTHAPSAPSLPGKRFPISHEKQKGASFVVQNTI